jgi:hypothetical protein
VRHCPDWGAAAGRVSCGGLKSSLDLLCCAPLPCRCQDVRRRAQGPAQGDWADRRHQKVQGVG